MDLNDTPEEAAFRKEVRSWIEANAERRGEEEEEGAAELFEERDEAAVLEEARVWQKKKFEAGWAGIRWPKEYGGRGLSPIYEVIWNQEVQRYRAPEAVFLIGIGMAGPTIITHGNDEQKKNWLPPMLEGKEIWCQLFSEPAAGSDAAGITTRAVLDGDELVVNGQKVWTSGAHYSKWGIMTVRTDVNQPKHKGMTFLVVDMEAPGVEVKPLRQMTGGANFNEVFFDNVRVPREHVVGRMNDGWRVAVTTLMNERVAIGTGGGGGGVKRLMDFLQKIDYGGGSASEDPLIRQEFARLYSLASVMKYTGYRNLTALSQGRPPGPEGSIGKLILVEFLARQAALAVKAAGPAGSLLGNDSPDGGRWSMLMLSYPGLKIAGGTDEILRNLIGERVLGLPKEPRVDKDVPFKDVPQGTLTAS